MRPGGDSKAPERRPLINFALAIYIHISKAVCVECSTCVVCGGGNRIFTVVTRCVQGVSTSCGDACVYSTLPSGPAVSIFCNV